MILCRATWTVVVTETENFIHLFSHMFGHWFEMKVKSVQGLLAKGKLLIKFCQGESNIK